MLPMRKLLVCVGFAALLFACGDNDISGDDTPDIDAAPGPDAEIPDAGVEPDAMVCPARMMGEVGGPCTTHADCDSSDGAGDGVCYRGIAGPVTFPPEGFCTLEDPDGTAPFERCDVDADCGDGNVCADSLGYKFCLPSCYCDGNTCPEDQACFESFNGFPQDKPACVPGDADAVDGDACNGFYDCDEYSSCRNDQLEFPGGQCQRYGCTVGDDTTCNGGTCIDNNPPFSGTTCVDTCTADTDCRMAEGYVCFDPDGAGGDALNYCRHPHVGDPCATAADCSGGAWVCRTEVIFTGGYCTQTGCATPGSQAGCSPGSICRDHPTETENYCADRCSGTAGTQGSCRTGYLCVDTNPDPDVTTLGCAPAGG